MGCVGCWLSAGASFACICLWLCWLEVLENEGGLWMSMADHGDGYRLASLVAGQRPLCPLPLSSMLSCDTIWAKDLLVQGCLEAIFGYSANRGKSVNGGHLF